MRAGPASPYGRRARRRAAPSTVDGGSGSSRPSRPITTRVSSCRSRHQVTSVRSPKVHTIAMPVPLAGSANGWAYTGTLAPKTGRTGDRPINAAYRSSSGWQTSATHAGSSSGRVVSTSTAMPSAPVKRSRWYAPVAPGPPARPAPPRCRTSRPTATAPRRCTPHPGRGCAGTPAARWRGRARRWSCTGRTSRSSTRAGATAPRTPARPRSVCRVHSSTKLRRAIGTWFSGSAASPAAERWVVGQRRVTVHAVLVLHPALGG